MTRRLATLTGLVCLLATADAFHRPILHTARKPTSPTSASASTVASPAGCHQSLSARSAAWTWSSVGGMHQQQRRREGRGGRVGFGVPRPLGAEAAAAAPAGNSDEAAKASDSSAIVAVEPDSKSGGGPVKRAFRRIARFFGAGKNMPNIKELGMYAILSYGFVSNASYAICIALAWFASSKKTGLSPLAPGQWQFFLVSYGAFFAINNVLRVPRFALSVSLAPTFDRIIAFLMKKTGRGKAVATGICVFMVNILGTCALVSSGILLASLLSGVPFWPVAAP